MPAKAKLNVHNFPRPPLLERTPRHLVIKWNNKVIADTTEGYWVLETTHPPTYYLPRSSLPKTHTTLAQIPNKSTFCEWKGQSTYWTIKTNPSDEEQKEEVVHSKIWSYESPTQPFKDIKGYLSFYASEVPWECFVDDEKVVPQPGDFYGGWSTSELEGIQKGGPGTWGW